MRLLNLAVAKSIAPSALGTVAITNATPAVVTLTPAVGVTTPIANGTQVAFTGAGLGTGLTAGTTYFVINTSGATFQVSATLGGSAIATTGDTTGTVNALLVGDPTVLAGPYDMQNVPSNGKIALTPDGDEPILPPTYAGDGTPTGAGEAPFLPGYNAVLITKMASIANVTNVKVQVSDDGTTWTDVITISANGGAATEITFKRYLRIVVNGVVSNTAGTLNAYILGNA